MHGSTLLETSSMIDFKTVDIKDESRSEKDKINNNGKQIPKRLKKYYDKRYKLFSKFDEGVQLNEELWYSVTPEKTAIFLLKLILSYFPKNKAILDVFSGGGGNAIQFAKNFDRIIGIDVNIDNIKCAIANSKVYGVNDKITYLNIDWLEICLNEKNFKELKDMYDVEILFGSPPWGGPKYLMQDVYDLNLLAPLGFKELLQSFFKITANVVIFLPRNSDINQLSNITRELLGDKAVTRILKVYDDNWFVGIFCFFGKIFTENL